MDSSTAAIEQEAAFAFEEAVELPLVGVSSSRPAENIVLDQSSSDLELCRLAATGNLSAFLTADDDLYVETNRLRAEFSLRPLRRD